MSIGDRIMKLRKEAGLSQEAFAEKLGVSRQSVSKWETNSATPELNKALAMCELFGVSSDYLLYGKETSTASEEEIKTTAEENAYEEVNAAEIYPEETNIDNLHTGEIYEESATAKKHTKSSHSKTAKIIAIVLACCILIVALIPVSYIGIRKLRTKTNESSADSPADNSVILPAEDPVVYPYVLVHGMGGWGESAGINSISPYWGASTGSLSEYLRGEGHLVYEATVGPFSSAWDRACELYAQLTGTTVDYGAAHSEEHGHERYGKEYTTPLYTEWGQKTQGGQIHKINLIGHSFGGTTVRLLASLMEYGNETEQNASPDDLSPLFKGGNGEWINSISTLCSPHNGSTLYYVVDKENLIPAALGLLQFAGDVTDMLNSNLIDFQLEHFGILSDSEDAMSLINKSFMSGNDNAFYDLSPHGAQKLNQNIKTVESIYYFSYSYCTTEKSRFSINQIPITSTILVLMPTATLIGSYTNTAEDAPVRIDENWLPNDGLVNVVSAKYPDGENYTDYTDGMKIKRGIWHVFPTLTGHHGTVIGMDGNTQETHEFYTNLIAMTDKLPRKQ